MAGYEFFRYVGVGLSNTLLTLLIYWALVEVTSHRVAYAASFVVGIVYSACANSRFTFKALAGGRALAVYALFWVALCTCNILILDILISEALINKRLAVLVVIAVGIPIGFAVSRFILKR